MYKRQRQAGHDQLRHEGHDADAAECLLPEDAGGDTAPGAAQAMQRPDAKHIVDLPAVLRQREHHDEQATGKAANQQRAHRMHDAGTGTHGDQSGELSRIHI